jgi:hypothetical protein
MVWWVNIILTLTRIMTACRIWPRAKVVINIIILYTIENTNLLSSYYETSVPNLSNFVIHFFAHSFIQYIFRKWLLYASSNREYKIIKNILYQQRL